jgi:hypothetical protein
METSREDGRWKKVVKNCVQWLALAMPVVIFTPDTMFPFILHMVGQYNDSIRSSENTKLDGSLDKKITNCKGAGMKHSCPSLNKGTEKNYDNFSYNNLRLAFHQID